MPKLHSMTGFGKATLELPAKKITFEIKSLNSKQMDVNIRLPLIFKEKETLMRKMISEKLQRGKVDLTMNCEITGSELAPKVNTVLVKSYIHQLQEITNETNASGDVLTAVMRLPDVLLPAENELDENEWKEISAALESAIEKLQKFRADEGATLQKDVDKHLKSIEKKLQKVPEFEADRIQRVREKMQRSLAEFNGTLDENRFEQELIYYLEKLDVTEEKVRLQSHLDYFEKLMDEGGAIGKKLGFVSQEIGREINTLGSKANHADMQKVVVQMKDDLEKIKEQVLNIL